MFATGNLISCFTLHHIKYTVTRVFLMLPKKACLECVRLKLLLEMVRKSQVSGIDDAQ